MTLNELKWVSLSLTNAIMPFSEEYCIVMWWPIRYENALQGMVAIEQWELTCRLTLHIKAAVIDLLKLTHRLTLHLKTNARSWRWQEYNIKWQSDQQKSAKRIWVSVQATQWSCVQPFMRGLVWILHYGRLGVVGILDHCNLISANWLIKIYNTPYPFFIYHSIFHWALHFSLSTPFFIDHSIFNLSLHF